MIITDKKVELKLIENKYCFSLNRETAQVRYEAITTSDTIYRSGHFS